MQKTVVILICLAWPGAAMADTASDAIEGDAEYGEYLSGTCLTCHRADGEYDGIPGITGWNQKRFVQAMRDYREGAREHDAMRLIAERLNNEEIAALAAYFAGLD